MSARQSRVAPEPQGETPLDPDLPESTEGLHVLKLTKDGDILVFDESSSREGYVELFSPAHNATRKFVADLVRPHLVRVADAAAQKSAFSAYAAYRKQRRSPPARPPARPAPALVPVPKSQELEETLSRLDLHDPRPLFVTGRAGTGKSTVLRQLAEAKQGRCMVLAPTGLAALNVGGQTIHSFFKFPTKPLGPGDIRGGQWLEVANKLDTLIVDEISMVRADLLDAIDGALRLRTGGRKKPFGGVRVAVFGDPYQLPPVRSKTDAAAFHALGYQGVHFFDARIARDVGLDMLEFTKVYRQHDPEWIATLDRMRTASLHDTDWRVLSTRVQPVDHAELADTIILTARRGDAEAVNQRRLGALRGMENSFQAEREGTFAKADGGRRIPAPDPLVLKRGARVMFIKNDPGGRWVNGTLGEVESLHSGNVTVRIDGGDAIAVDRQKWQQIEYEYDEDMDMIKPRVIGQFSQFPLQLAWAITIHKSQGLTFDRVHVDLGNGAFDSGQTYVALSRCRTLEGLTLERELRESDLRCDARVERFMTRARLM